MRRSSRSVANGPYFEDFRRYLLRTVAIDRLHIFESRSTVFSDTGVLQENIVLSAIRDGTRSKIRLTASHGHTDTATEHVVDYDMVRPEDPIVLVHAKALLTSSLAGKTAYIDADLRDAESIISSAELRQTLDLSQPVALLLIAIMHFIGDEDEPYGLTRRLLEALPAGSYLALSHLTGDFDPEAWAGVAAVYAKSGVTLKVRSRPEIERFFDGLDLVEPGVQSLPGWRPDPSAYATGRPTDAEVSVYGGIAHKPA